MRHRSLALAVATLASSHVATAADAQSVYVAPGNGYAVPPYVAPAPGYVAPSAYVAPAPAYPAPAYVAPVPAYAAPGYVEGEPGYVVRERRVAPLAAYAAELPPRPPAAVPYRYGGRCVFRSGYGRWEYCD
jgi:hypothetical protein